MSNMSRFNQILLGILAIQIAVAGFVFWSTSASSSVSSGPLFTEFEVAEVTQVLISDGDNQLVLAKEGEGWILPEAGSFPANGEGLLPLLEKIQGIQTNRLVTTTDASHKRLQVDSDDYNRLIEFTLSDGNSHRLYIGSSAGASATHVRADWQPEVYLTGELNAFEANPQASSWVETLYFTVPQSATTKITLENENGTFEVERVDEESWTLADLAEEELFNTASATTLLNQVTNIRLNDPLGTEPPSNGSLDDPAVSVTVEAADETYTLEFGATGDEDGTYVLKASNSPYYVQVAQFTGDNLVNKVRDDFIQEPELEEGSAEETDGVQIPLINQ